MAKKTELKVRMPNVDVKGKVKKFEVDNPRESDAAAKNIYISKKALIEIGDPSGVEVIIRPIN
jgi:hypothetical protein